MNPPLNFASTCSKVLDARRGPRTFAYSLARLAASAGIADSFQPQHSEAPAALLNLVPLRLWLVPRRQSDSSFNPRGFARGHKVTSIRFDSLRFVLNLSDNVPFCPAPKIS